MGRINSMETEYITIGDKRVCPKCGHTAGYKQIDIVLLLKEGARQRRIIDQLVKEISHNARQDTQD